MFVDNSEARQNYLTKNARKGYLTNHRVESKIILKKPFWLSSVNYYFLTVGISIACFFITWGILHAVEEEMPWITAGVLAGLILILSVILRELVFKKAYNKTLLAQKRLDYNIKSVYKQNRQRSNTNRLTLERNAKIINDIENRSKSIKSIGRLSEPHFEVLELCNEYLRKSNRELEGIYKESPRYGAIKRGQKQIKQLHYYHLLSWASIESQQYLQTAKVQVGLNDKIENAQRALQIIDTAIQFYPEDENLLQSKEAINEFVVSVKVSHWIEQAERSAFKGNNQRAILHYRDALYFLARENKRTTDKDILAEQINFKIEELKIKKIN